MYKGQKMNDIKILIKNKIGMALSEAIVSIKNAPESFQEISAITDDKGFVKLPSPNVKGSYEILVYYNGIGKNFKLNITQFEKNYLIIF